MAIKDTTRKPFIDDNDENIFIGIDLPFYKSNGVDGWFASTKTTIEAVKNNIKNLLQTHSGERLMQPLLGLNLRQYLFEQVNEDTKFAIQQSIVDKFRIWLPFVNIQDIEVIMNIDDTSLTKNTMNVKILFNIVQDPSTLESVQVEIGE